MFRGSAYLPDAVDGVLNPLISVKETEDYLAVTHDEIISGAIPIGLMGRVGI